MRIAPPEDPEVQVREGLPRRERKPRRSLSLVRGAHPFHGGFEADVGVFPAEELLQLRAERRVLGLLHEGPLRMRAGIRIKRRWAAGRTPEIFARAPGPRRPLCGWRSTRSCRPGPGPPRSGPHRTGPW